MSEYRKDLTTCAYCPNTCRSGYAAAAPVQIESQTPSALSLITLAVLDGRLSLDEETRKTLGRRGPTEASVGQCTYGLNMPAAIDAALLTGTAHG
ncbi:hypothetical protein D3870_04855 [Noviherbaspirillum cavernae]|uniref:Uncharacterized protein n=1 Tax=Noviherbaspirillum cavernae TaxID=2320862 RepID=A0A418WYY1_9BURK|nr:hypothetical protein [Noviherbaspirillum cavernae]RJG05440.1 hypothetical protein D3870_04855 [Noviherbaspirillum cavernae]